MPEMLAMTEGAGGLFDFNATLPLMAIQFILLTVVLKFPIKILILFFCNCKILKIEFVKGPEKNL